jgi:general nucleoside transport system permease protein
MSKTPQDRTPEDNKVPFWSGLRVKAVPEISAKTLLLSRLIAVLAALVLAALVIKFSGLSPTALGLKAFRSTFGSSFGLEQLGLLLTPILITAIAASIAFKMGLWNIGVEGQLYFGALSASGLGIFMIGPNIPMLVLLAVASMIGGALWALIPALARAYAQVNEIISTLMLNFVAILIVNYLSIGPWRDKSGVGVMAASARIPYVLPDWFEALHVGIFFGLILLVLYGLVVRFTQFGYEVDLIGSNNGIGPYIGVNTAKRIVAVMLISGAIAGLAGMIEITGNIHRLQDGLSNDFGLYGIIVAVLARGQPLGVLIGSVFIAFILNAGLVLQSAGLSVNSVLTLTGLILLLVTCAEMLARYRVTRTAT